ncbi:MAG: deoxynucleoside kinase [archaeon]
MYSGTMIISFEGNVYSGKTTLISELKKLDKFIIIPEYSYFFKENDFQNLDAWSLQKKYMETDIQRVILLENGEKSLVDRSILSQAAHVWASYKLNIVDIRKEFLEKLSAMIKQNRIIIPDLFITVKCSHDLIKKRYKLGENSKQKKQTNPLLIKKEYLIQIEYFLKKISSKIPSETIDTTELNEMTSTRILFQKIREHSKSKKYDLFKIIKKQLFQN